MTKNETGKRSNLIYWIVAALLLIGCLIYAINPFKKGKVTCDIVFFGDSRVGNYRTETGISAKLTDITGLTVFNAGIGGTSMAVSDDDGTWDKFSMAALSEAIATNDFSVQDGIRPTKYIEYNEIINYFPECYEGIKNLDWKSPRYIVIEQGTNDYFAAVPLDNPDNLYDNRTFKGAIRTSVKNLQKVCPQAEIILVSTSATLTAAGFSEETDFGYGFSEMYADAMKEVSLELGVSYVDFYHEIGITRDNIYVILYDGLHLSEEAALKMAEMISEYIK